MARISSDNFADGWQDKKVSERLREVRQELTTKDRTAARQMMDNLTHSKNTAGPRTSEANQKQPESAVPRTEAPRAPQAAESARPEVANEAARFSRDQQQAYQNARSNSHELNQLANQGSRAFAANAVATRDAVAPKTPANLPNLSQQPQPQAQPQIPTNAVPRTPYAVPNNRPQESPIVRPDPNDPNAETPYAVRRTPYEIDPNAASPESTIVRPDPNAETLYTVRRTPYEGEDQPEAGESRDRSASVYRAGSSPGARAGERLSGLLDGSVSSNAGGEDGAEDGGTEPRTPYAVHRTEEIPQSDSSLIVFNEYDEANPGIETVLARRNILERHVIKSMVSERLQEIRELDATVTQRISDIYATRSLSDRIVSDTEEDLRIYSSKFHKSIYGGLIG